MVAGSRRHSSGRELPRRWRRSAPGSDGRERIGAPARTGGRATTARPPESTNAARRATAGRERSAARARTGAPAADVPSSAVTDADRERELRRLERDRRRRERGAQSYFDAQPLLVEAGPDDPTVVLRPGVLPPRRDAAGAAPADEPARSRLAVSTAIFAAATGLSRLLGLVREVVAAYYFGAAGQINAFTLAYQLPNLVRALVADAALSSAFVPVFIDLLRTDKKRAWRVASTIVWLMRHRPTALSALFFLVAPWAVGLFGDPGHDQALAVGLSRVLFPMVGLLGVSGIIVGILNSYEHFTVPALAPVFWNLAIIAGLAIGVPRADSDDGKLYVCAVSILVATLIQVFLPVPWL